MTVKAMNEYILVRPLPLELKTASGLYLDAKDVSPSAIVVSVGSLCKSKVRPGDQVVFPRGLAFEKFKHDGVEHWIVQENRVLLVVNDGENSGS